MPSRKSNNLCRLVSHANKRCNWSARVHTPTTSRCSMKASKHCVHAGAAPKAPCCAARTRAPPLMRRRHARPGAAVAPPARQSAGRRRPARRRARPARHASCPRPALTCMLQALLEFVYETTNFVLCSSVELTQCRHQGVTRIAALSPGRSQRSKRAPHCLFASLLFALCWALSAPVFGHAASTGTRVLLGKLLSAVTCCGTNFLCCHLVGSSICYVRQVGPHACAWRASACSNAACEADRHASRSRSAAASAAARASAFSRPLGPATHGACACIPALAAKLCVWHDLCCHSTPTLDCRSERHLCMSLACHLQRPVSSMPRHKVDNAQRAGSWRVNECGRCMTCHGLGCWE